MKSDIICWVCVFCLAAFPAPFARSVDSETPDIATSLQSQGVEEKTAKAIADGIKKAQDENNLAPVINLLNSESQDAFVTACVLARVDPGSRILLKILEKEDIKEPENLIYAFAFTTDKKVIDYLVTRLQKETTAEVKQAIVFVLRVVCEQKIPDEPAKWLTWWNDNQAKFELHKELDVEKLERAFKIECQHLRIRLIKGILKVAITKNGQHDESAEKVQKVFGGMMQSLTSVAEGVEKLHYSEHAKKGYDLWRQGSLDEAVEAFHQSIKDNPEDIHSRYMAGFLLVETDKFKEAEKEFDAIAGKEKECEMAKFLKRFCQHRQENRDSDIFASLFYALKKSKFDEDNFWRWNDKMLPALLGQATLGEGPFVINKDKLQDIAQKSKNPATVVAVGLMQDKGKEASSLEVRDQEFKDSIVYQTALLRLYMENCDEQLKKIMSKCEALKKLAPENGFYPLMLVYYSDYDAKTKGSSTNSPPLSQEQIRMIEDAINVKEFKSYSTDITRACIDVLREAKTPFGEISGLGRGVGLMAHYSIYRSLARRLKATAEKEGNEGHGSYARSIGEMIIKLGDKVESDNRLIINHLVTEAVRGLGREVIIKQAEKDGIVTTAKKYRELNDEAKKIRKEFTKNVGTLCCLSTIPVPKIQRAIIEKTLCDEVGFCEKLPDLK